MSQLSTSKKIPTIGIVIPCYNEAANLPALVARCREATQKFDCEFLFVENGSNDNSIDFLQSIHGDENLNYIQLEKNAGYGGAIIEGMRHLENQYIGWTHADLQTDPLDVGKCLEVLKDNIAFIKGRRRKRSFIDTVFTSGMSISMSLLFNCLLFDINAQPTILERKLWESWKNPPTDFSLDLFAYVYARTQKSKMARFPVDFHSRYAGKSSWNSGISTRLKLSRKTLKYALKLKKELLK